MDNNTTPEKKGAASPFGGYGIVIICILLILVCLAPFVVSLLGQQASDDPTQNNNIAKTQFEIDHFPYPLTVCGKDAPILDITFLELHENHGYTGYLVYTLDRRNLTDDELYWLLDGHYYVQELTTLAHYRPEGGDMAEMEYLGARYNDLYIYFAWRTDLHRHSLKDCYVSAKVSYRPEYAEAKDRQHYSYLFYFSDDHYQNSTDCLTDGAASSLAEMVKAADN